jgi:hypothetical protein
MTYSKPEVTILGDAALVIQGSKSSQLDQGTSQTLQMADCEFDD